MTLADERLEGLDNPSLTEGERVLRRCRAAANLIHTGQYEAAREALGELWRGIGQRPDIKGFPPTVAAEVLLQCGALTGWIGSAKNVVGADDGAKDLLTEALRLFQAHREYQKASETQYELGFCYWRAGAHDEARIVMHEALKPLGDEDVELKAKILIRLSTVEIWENRYYVALRILEEAESVFQSSNNVLKGRWNGQMALVLIRLALVEGNAEYTDRAIIAFTAASFHYEQAGNERYCAINLNNLAMTLYRLERYEEAHEHLDRAQLIFTKLKDADHLAQVDETRARVLLAEKRYREANRVIARVITTFEAGDSALLADALTLQGVIWARLGNSERSVDVIRRAMDIAQQSGALTQAGQAALTLLEEHGSTWRLPGLEAAKVYLRAHELLKGTQDAEDTARLLACALIVIKRLSGMRLHEKNFTFYGAVQEMEAMLIERALELEGGSITRAAKRLGLRRQSLTHMLESRHKGLADKRMPPKKRRRSIIKEPKLT